MARENKVMEVTMKYYVLLIVCLYPSILIAGLFPSKTDDAAGCCPCSTSANEAEPSPIVIEATLYEQTSEDDGPKQLSYDFDNYNPAPNDGYARDKIKHTYTTFARSKITLSEATIEGQSAKIIYFVALNEAIFHDTHRADIKIDAEPKKIYLDQTHYALLCAKRMVAAKK
jgi:hypothetical protein